MSLIASARGHGLQCGQQPGRGPGFRRCGLVAAASCAGLLLPTMLGATDTAVDGEKSVLLLSRISSLFLLGPGTRGPLRALAEHDGVHFIFLRSGLLYSPVSTCCAWRLLCRCLRRSPGRAPMMLDGQLLLHEGHKGRQAACQASASERP